MKVSVETLPTSEAVLNVDFSWEELEKASDKAYHKLVQKVDIQGFRRGKAPRSLLERKLGKEYIYQEGLDDLMNETYRDTLKEHNLVPLTQPDLDAPVLEMGQPYHFTLKVPILPEAELGDYKSLHFERESADVTSEEVEKELEQARQRKASWNEVERPAQIGDRVTMDLKLSVGDKTVSDLKDNPFELTDERHGLFKGLDEQIVGLQKGEHKTFSATIPEDYSNEKYAGQASDYDVMLHKIEFRELPELDDAFAIEASDDQQQTIEDYRKAVSDRLLDTKKRALRDALREKVLNAVVEQAQVTVPPVLVHEEQHEMMHQMGHMLEQQRMSLDQYLMLTKQTEEEYEESLKPEAEKRVRQQLVLDAVIKAENIKVAPEELESIFRFYAQIGQPLPQNEDQIRSVASSLLREKAVSRLIELTTDPDPDAETEEEEVEATEEAARTAAVEAEALESGLVESEAEVEAIEAEPETKAEAEAETTGE
ncbi:MAG TPA: trigger factor [Ktedonobacteraceae bacterium]